ncbi:MAG: hypothetical protein RLZZ344_506 [Pseudomonadota bacterium]
MYPQQVEDRIADMMTGGWRGQATHQLVGQAAPPAASIRPLSTSPVSETPAWSEFRKYADLRFDLSPTRVVLIARAGRLEYARYLQGKADPLSTPIGNSMSKSLVSLAVGKAVCSGDLKSLEEPLASLLPDLRGTSWGATSVRDTLRMSSGAFIGDTLRPTGWRDEEDTKVNRAVYSRQLTRSYIDLMKRFDQKAVPPGRQFNYNNYDTVALGLAVEAATRRPFASYFSEAVWAEVGAESQGAWVTNEKGEVAGYFGFSARPADWLRLGIWVLEQRTKDDCFGQYLRLATTHQIDANWPLNKSYGYQIWTNCTKKPGTFCFLGNHGQQLIFNPDTQSVLYVHATSNATNMVWREVFDRLP